MIYTASNKPAIIPYDISQTWSWHTRFTPARRTHTHTHFFGVLFNPRVKWSTQSQRTKQTVIIKRNCTSLSVIAQSFKIQKNKQSQFMSFS